MWLLTGNLVDCSCIFYNKTLKRRINCNQTLLLSCSVPYFPLLGKLDIACGSGIFSILHLLCCGVRFCIGERYQTTNIAYVYKYVQCHVSGNHSHPTVCLPHLQLWDEGLARTAEAWAATCLWEHGPPYLLRFYGQNLSVRTGG